jgi:predicted LPLAT superfamily acyltransferase
MFGGHVGSFEVLRAIALDECPVPVRVMMHDRHAEKLARVLRQLNATLPAQVIPLGRPQAMLDARNALHHGELVALLADRSMYGDRQVQCDFLGGRAGFPRGPFELAAMLDAPVVLFCATYSGRGRYDIRIEPLDLPSLAGETRDQTLDRRCRAYAAWLEARVREAPYNWFNFYDFWARPVAASQP